MKKITLLFLSLVMCVAFFALTGCGDNSDSSSVSFDNAGVEIEDDMTGFENSDEASKNTNGGIWTDGN